MFVFCKKSVCNRLLPDIFLFFKRVLYEVKGNGLQFSFNVLIALNLEYNQNKIYKTLDRDTLKFDFLEKCLAIVSPRYFVYDFSRKFFFMLYSIN